LTPPRQQVRAHRAWVDGGFFRDSLTGSLGLQAKSSRTSVIAKDLLQLRPGRDVEHFNAGKFRSNIAVQNAREEQQVVIYQQTG